ncbi:MAG: hypothetical protein CMI16_06105 [Opitutaceae bacterium]|nr:hypothetical protein [Opitutaceae bacterium]|tara:strand:+ start:1432 stop:2322 length:891 start_codon:yes stop_codon:yes gene_type:complete
MNPTADILATAVVPWTKSYEFDEDKFCHQVHEIARGLTPNIYVFGTAGEGYAVTESQFDHISTAFWSSSQECDAFPMLGIISLSLPTIIERIERGRALSFRDFQLSLPSWGELNDRELDTFFAETCGRFPDCHFHHYNLVRTKRFLTSVEYTRLAEAHPNLVAVKAGTRSPEVIADLLKVSPRLRFYFTEYGYTHARRTHDVGFLVSLASANPERAKAFVAGDDARRTADLEDLQAMLESLKELSTDKFHIDGGFDKMIYKVNDPSFPLRLLPPYAGPTDEDFATFRADIADGWMR